MNLQEIAFDGWTWKFRVTEDAAFATAVDEEWTNVLFMSDEAGAPDLFDWTWQVAVDPDMPSYIDVLASNGEVVRLLPYRLVSVNGVPVELPSDCIQASQLTSAGMREGTLDSQIGFDEPLDAASDGGGVAGPLGDAPDPGEALICFAGNDGDPGNFHAATILVRQGSTIVTIESDVPEDGEGSSTLRSTIFDMYDEASYDDCFYARLPALGQGRMVYVDAVESADFSTALDENGMIQVLFGGFGDMAFEEAMSTSEMLLEMVAGALEGPEFDTILAGVAAALAESFEIEMDIILELLLAILFV